MNPIEERNAVLGERAEDWRKDGLIDAPQQAAAEGALATRWKTNGLLVRLVFFFFASLALGTFYGFWRAIGVPGPGILTALAGIGLAEYLIRTQKWFWTGVEEALWVGGGLAFLSALPSSGKPESMLVIGAVFAASCARVRNPLFGAIAAIFVMVWGEMRFDGGTAVAIVIASLAMIALLREWERPSTEWLFVVTMLVLPLAGRFAADGKWWRVTIALYATFGFAALLLAMMRRHHAYFVASMIGLSIAVVDAARRVEMPVETKFAAAGVFLLALAFALSRALRARTNGFVLAPSKLTPFDDEMQIAGAMVAAAENAPPSQQQPVSGGGGFGQSPGWGMF
jgi:hypothetical protein